MNNLKNWKETIKVTKLFVAYNIYNHRENIIREENTPILESNTSEKVRGNKLRKLFRHLGTGR